MAIYAERDKLEVSSVVVAYTLKDSEYPELVLRYDDGMETAEMWLYEGAISKLKKLLNEKWPEL